jgi:hypothetical protein
MVAGRRRWGGKLKVAKENTEVDENTAALWIPSNECVRIREALVRRDYEAETGAGYLKSKYLMGFAEGLFKAEM